jgi:hypothetical protein
VKAASRAAFHKFQCFVANMSGQTQFGTESTCEDLSLDSFPLVHWSVKNLQKDPWLAQHWLTEVKNMSGCYRLSQVPTVSRTKRNTRAHTLMSWRLSS